MPALAIDPAAALIAAPVRVSQPDAANPSAPVFKDALAAVSPDGRGGKSAQEGASQGKSQPSSAAPAQETKEPSSVVEPREDEEAEEALASLYQALAALLPPQPLPLAQELSPGAAADAPAAGAALLERALQALEAQGKSTDILRAQLQPLLSGEVASSAQAQPVATDVSSAVLGGFKELLAELSALRLPLQGELPVQRQAQAVPPAAVPLPASQPEAAHRAEASVLPQAAAAPPPQPPVASAPGEMRSKPSAEPFAPAIAVSAISGAPRDEGGAAQGGDSGQDGAQQPLLATPPAAVSVRDAAPAESTGFIQVLQQASPAAPVEQVAAQVRALHREGMTHMQIQLNPVELGEVSIRLDIGADGQAKLQLTAEKPHALAMLSSDAKALENMLRDVGLKADAGSLSFHLRDERQPGQQDNQQQSRRGNRQPAQAAEAVEEALMQTAARAYTLAEGLNIRV